MKKNWTSVSLNKKQICFLDRTSKNCRFSSGRKLSRTSILRALLTAAKKLNIDVGSVRSEEDLRRRILKSFRQAD